MTDVHQYTAFGLTIQSDRPIEQLQRSDGFCHDVSIRQDIIEGHLPQDWHHIAFRNWRASQDYFCLDVEGVAKYLVKAGREIVVEPDPQADNDDIDAYLLGSAFAALLQQLRMLTLHASAIETSKGAVLFIGKSGAGKSTLLAAMLARGYVMMSDDISALKFDLVGNAMMQPAFPTARLRGSAFAKLGQPKHGLEQVRSGEHKFLVPVRKFCPQPRPIHKVFLLTSWDQPEIEIRPLSQSAQFGWLSHFTFRKNYYRGHGLEPFHFKTVSALARRDTLAQVIRPQKKFLLDELADGIEKVIG